MSQSAALPDRRLPDARPDNWVDRWAPLWLRPWLKLGRFDRPAGIWLLMLPGWQGVALADALLGHLPDLRLLGLIAVGATAMRAAGCAFNDIVDRKMDAKVARTANRPVASGRISVKAAWIYLVGLSLAALCVLLCMNLTAILLGVGSLALVAAYPFMKRITWWPQAWLGLTFNWGALLGYAAVRGKLDWPAAVLYASGIFWTLGYDTIYAVQDIEDDALAGVKSSARRLGRDVRAGVMAFYAITILLLGGLTKFAPQGWPLLFAAAAHLTWQASQVKRDDPEGALRLFKSNRDVGLLVFAALAVAGWRRLHP
ncbi:4-hydroxybenzoate octaprenyltransferase [Caulobacter sp. S45]|uniref:4-hydroxybenzoate octaprenyltransferase n=1 Tax=Caulobacter sp. S45 TaxID=1641861 RepID=UPI00131E506C|nr:4-hydroxybenzoate octaprenyltransferase [Caulobacter sp. S45]